MPPGRLSLTGNEEKPCLADTLASGAENARERLSPMLVMGTCPACGHRNASDVMHCDECGRPLPPRPGMATAKPVGAEDGGGSGSR